MSKISITPAYECASLAVQNEARARVREAAQRQRGHTLPQPSLPPSLPPGDTDTTTSPAAGTSPDKLLELLDKKQKRYEAERLAHLKATTTPEGISDTLAKLDKANELSWKYSRPK